MIKAVIFDLDGTLVDSLQDLCDSTNFALQKFGFPTHEVQKYKYFVGDGIPKLIERVIPKESFNKEIHKKVLAAFMERYREHYLDKTAPYNGVKESLAALLAAKVKLAVVSNKADEMAPRVVNKLFSGEFTSVTGKREDYPLKPNPALTLKVIEDLGVKPCECAFLGDSGMDMATAKNAGCVAVGVLWGFRTRDELLDNGADYIINNPSKIASFILGLE